MKPGQLDLLDGNSAPLVPGMVDQVRAQVEALGLNHLGLLQGHRTFDHVLELSHVARPGVSLQSPGGTSGQTGQRLSKLLAEPPDGPARQGQDVDLVVPAAGECVSRSH